MQHETSPRGSYKKLARMPASQRMRALLKRGGPIAAGCYDTLSARLAELTGFEYLHVTGFGVEATLLGSPDMGILTLSELAAHVGHITSLVDLPIICDVDTGFGGIESIFRTVREMERIGVAGMHIEDVGAPKRNPFIPGRVLLPLEEAVGRVKAACAARTDPDFLIIARSDADELSFDELVNRCNSYLRAGADVAMPVLARVDGKPVYEFTPEEQIELHRALTSRIDGPVLGMGVPQGYTASQMIEVGYAMMILPMVSLIPAASAVLAALKETAAQNGIGDDAARDNLKIDSVLDIMGILKIDEFIENQRKYSNAL
jgi:methylisocitrate lyase